MSTRQEFDIQVEGRGPNGAWAHIVMPFDVPAVFGAKNIIPVSGTVNGFPFRTSIAPKYGEFYFVLNKEMQQGAKASVGDTVHIVLDIDREPRAVDVPQDLTSALEAAPAARAAFDSLGLSHKKEYVRWIEEAKKAETRDRRINETITRLTASP